MTPPDASSSAAVSRDLGSRFRHDTWANDRVLARLRELDDPDTSCRGLLAHIAAGLRVWVMRIDGEDSRGVAIFPDLSLDECASWLAADRPRYDALIERISLGGERVDRLVRYVNQHERAYETSVGDILTHVLLHGAYHRGQINQRLRAAGHAPVSVDHIAWTRETSGQDGS